MESYIYFIPAGGAFKFPYTSGPVPSKSNIAEPVKLSMVTDNLMGDPSSK